MWLRGLAGGAGAGAALLAVRLPERRWQTGRPQPKPLCCDELRSLERASQALLEPAIQYAELHGLLYAAKDRSADGSLATQCPVAMMPFKVPEQAFHFAVSLAPLWNRLVDKAARDVAWLHATLDRAADADPFCARLLQISKTLHKEGLRQPIMFGIHRSDYMLHEAPGEVPRFLQVELNTIASSMLSHSWNVEHLHRFVLSRYGTGVDEIGKTILQHYGLAEAPELLQSRLPKNKALEVVPDSIAAAHRIYGATGAAEVVFIVQDDERNFADQRWIEYALWERHAVKVRRMTLADVHSEAALDADGRLRLNKGKGVEISVVYFRAGYTPDDYPTEKEWEARTTIERSLAIKSPSVDYQLVGMKKVQQALARPGEVERFLNRDASAELRKSFAGLWGLGPGEDDAAIIAAAKQSPEGFVLKPQREGGGHNFYGRDVAQQLSKMSVQERGAYILMQRILPKLQATVMTREGKLMVSPGLAEFGFYSVFIGNGRTEFLSEHAGHLCRTKAEGVDEGGVAAGYAVINSPFLTP